MPYKNKEDMNEYMRTYRARLKEEAKNSDWEDDILRIWLREETTSRLSDLGLDHDQIYRLVIDVMYPFVEKEFPYLSPMKRDIVLDTHLLFYIRTGVMKDFDFVLKHPALMPFPNDELVQTIEAYIKRELCSSSDKDEKKTS